MQVFTFTFNPFQENTYVLADQSGEAVIIDPGCYTTTEKESLKKFIIEQGLSLRWIILTHSHIDHMLGCKFVSEAFKIPIGMHRKDVEGLRLAPAYGLQWGIQAEVSPEPELLLEEGDQIKFGNTVLDIVFTPGHSQGSISLIHHASGSVMSGDVLFYESIGRTDLPGGGFEILEKSIREKLYVLPENYKVFPGHGPATMVGYEKRNNPFVTSQD